MTFKIECLPAFDFARKTHSVERSEDGRAFRLGLRDCPANECFPTVRCIHVPDEGSYDGPDQRPSLAYRGGTYAVSAESVLAWVRERG